MIIYVFFFSSRRRHTRWPRDWSSDVCSSDLKNYELQNLLNLIDRKITNKELKTTLFNELKSKQNKIEQLEQELNIKEESILSLKKSHDYLQQLNKKQQDLISQVFHYLLKKSSQENLVFFDYALKNIFSKPLDYLTLLRDEKTQNKNNVADFFKNRLKIGRAS